MPDENWAANCQTWSPVRSGARGIFDHVAGRLPLQLVAREWVALAETRAL